ncbi:hypothetical protein ACJMK2_022353 [Sinanodonta woodiana]|uniref:Nucleoside phosphorylase domain-containing protein n=1 Tax=Sinanodonta woodiana TaxID=1069815 RepID=A0ABD3TK47_SINWO
MDCTTEDNDIKQNKTVRVKNPHLLKNSVDHLYHICLSNISDDLEKRFGDVKFVCFGGTPSRMSKFTQFISSELGVKYYGDVGSPTNITGSTDRYAMYKAGPVLAVSHGIGIPSLSIVLQEVVKLVHYAKCQDVAFFRIGTSGGLGVEPGTVVVTEKVVNGALEPFHQSIVLGKSVARPAVVDKEFAKEIYQFADSSDKFKTVLGTTLCADDFYEGQGRIDGAFCDHDHDDKLNWLKHVHSQGVCNIEMESLGFITMCHRANVKGAVICVTLLDRFNGDMVTMDHGFLSAIQKHPQIIVARYIKHAYHLLLKKG